MNVLKSERMLKVVLLTFSLAFNTLYCIGSFASDEYVPLQGDIIFQSLPNGDIANAIEGATRSPYSHVGIVISTSTGWKVREAIESVHDTDLSVFIERGRNNSIDVFRLKSKYQKYIPKFIRATQKYLNHPYDIRYRMDDESIYCSELIYKAFNDATGLRMGKLVKLGELHWGKYEKLIKSIEGGTVPINRKMITPVDLSKALQLELIYSSF
ncbi:YiiX/YebB-like N1pC/P60 family cysteine hydrolase [Agarilytica rhodophyticola]|uniref:YiiX/YebB-like N1pC/P60 family cysteine hydrolase n=1 Tax=Agarilytica rhodophyticola TaxID=1737490 RepID=UPI000B3412D6|nr:YiiX/YebB-like N1pC/P60 family cysteine hydrolase [Agarilytica rhodophyticola]